MSNQDRQNLSEEKLKELQRKEALSTSDEYDIQDQTYDSAPLTRQYVKDDVVAKGAQFVIEDDEDDMFASERHGDVIMDYDDEEDVERIVENKFLSERLNFVLKKNLSSREYQIICMRYGLNGMPILAQREVASKLQISRSYISRLEKKILQKLKKEIAVHCL